eukprot:gene5068-7072_t
MDVSEDSLQSIGFMFDAEHCKNLRSFSFSNFTIKYLVIDENPGHMQSGQYLWPAATAACQHILENWSLLSSEYVLELGAGCGLTGLFVSYLPNVIRVVFSDYDPGCVQLINENIQLNHGSNSNHKSHYLEWGEKISNDQKKLFEHPPDGFQLIIGTDLIYCKGVVQPLFKSVKEYLDKNNGTFVLCSSFSLDEDIENEINYSCYRSQLQRLEVMQLDVENKQSRIEYYKHIE